MKTLQYDLTTAILELKRRTGGFVTIEAKLCLSGESKPELTFVAYTADGGHSDEFESLQEALEGAVTLYEIAMGEQRKVSDRFIISI